MSQINIEKVKSYLGSFRDSYLEITDENKVLNIKYRHLDIEVNFFYGLEEHNDLFRGFVSLETKRSANSSDFAGKDRKKIIQLYENSESSCLGECFYLADDIETYVFKTTLFCKEEYYVSMLSELLPIHFSLHEKVSREIQTMADA